MPLWSLAIGVLIAAVRVDVPADTSCPSRAQVEKALGGNENPTPGADWSVHYQKSSEPEKASDQILIEIRDAAGNLALTRKLSVDESDCSGAAMAIASVARRAVTHLTSTANEKLPPLAERPPPPQVTMTPSAPPVDARFILGIGAGYWPKFQSIAGVSLGARMRIVRWLDADLRLGVLPESRVTVAQISGVNAKTRHLIFSAGAPFCLNPFNALRLGLGPSFEIAMQWAKAMGTPVSAVGRRAMVSAGISGSAELRMARWLILSVELDGYGTLHSPNLLIVGYGPVLKAPSWHTDVHARLGVSF